MNSGTFIFGIYILCGLVLAGCAQKIDPERSIEEIRLEATKMSESELTRTIALYVKEIEKEKREFEQIKKNAKRLSAKEVFGPKGEEVKRALTEARSHIEILQSHHQAYLEFKK